MTTAVFSPLLCRLTDGTCPIVVTRTFTVTDLCDNTAQAQQTINIDDQTDPTIAAPATANIAGCGTADITGLAYSETAVTITLAQLTTAGGS